jgi:hypothetical protein
MSGRAGAIVGADHMSPAKPPAKFDQPVSQALQSGIHLTLRGQLYMQPATLPLRPRERGRLL